MQFKNGKKIQLWRDNTPTMSVKDSMREYRLLIRPYLKKTSKEIPSITPYLIPTEQPNSVVLIAPGGGYMGRANHEGKDIALWLNSLGISAFVLNYRHAPFRHPIPFLDGQRAIRLIRYYHKEFNINPNKLAMLGFSAGGHLTSTISTLKKRAWFFDNYFSDKIDAVDDTPNASILCYPVISLVNMPHEGSRYNLLGKKPDPNLMNMLSTESQIGPHTPPTFIWTTKTDGSVSYLNSSMYADALKRVGIDFEFHLFPEGRHGLGLAEGHLDVSQWTKLCSEWLKKQCF
jgi:acetyl esterase/lipase